MRGKVINKEGRMYVEYTTVGAELDEVEKKQIKIAFYDQEKVSIGEEVEFECDSFYTVDGVELATIKTK